MAAAKRGGRRPKGDREPMHTRVPRDHKGVYEAAAEAEGLPLGDYVALQMARLHGLDEPDYLHPHQGQQALLGRSAGQPLVPAASQDRLSA